MQGDEARLQAAACDGYIAKPINLATFAWEARGYLLPRPPLGAAPDPRYPAPSAPSARTAP